ncbi:vang-like protein 1, partial [Bombina bombina]|uniref:vang-like protein 1 n=1 Tax=Bombina bombina TaxID=8345 RepID=UPI00235A4E0C
IQRTALFVLENYYKDFPMFNHEPPVTKKTRKQDQHSVLKMYNVDEKYALLSTAKMAAAPTPPYLLRQHTSVHQRLGHSMRRHTIKQYALLHSSVTQVTITLCLFSARRLVMAVEEAFSQLQSMAGKTEDSRASHVLNPREAAQSIFPLIAQSLQRYLRTTQQSHLHSMEGIVHHLTFCLSQGMSPQAFLEQYLRPGPPQQYPTAPVGLWTLVSEESVTCPVRSGLAFSLYTLDTRLVVSVNEIPVLRLNETFIPPNSHRFTIRDRPESIL